ncbi:MAG TPA: hypothetical protein VKU41_18545 [Polyangiaceae bacterium]|nr:hypothetical protein [Polyangiaceae bacterium]
MAVVASLALAACAPIAGLDKYSSGECTGACLDATTGAKPSDTPRTEGMPGMATTPGQGVDAEAGATPQEDAPTSPNGDADQGSAPEGGGTEGGGAEGAAADAQGTDGGMTREAAAEEAGVDCGPTDTLAQCTACGAACDTTHSLDAGCTASGCAYSGCSPGWFDCDPAAPNADGCETPSSPSNCGACGRACDKKTGTPSCTGATCRYACNTGHSDCNAATAPDLDGCECATPQCCGTGCQTTHSNGVGQNFYDCLALGTYNALQQLAACVAFTGDAAKCMSVNMPSCPAFLFNPTMAVCSTGSQCDCWFLPAPGATQGTVQAATGSVCGCPVNNSPTWN